MIIRNGEVEYAGQVIYTYEHYWLDGMTEEYAAVWDFEEHEVRSIPIGYYGSDGCNLYGAVKVSIDPSEAVVRDILRTLRRNAAKAFCDSVIEYKTGIRKGTHAEVVRGKKVPKGTKLEVFWVGERPTFRSRGYSWMNETETIAGCYDENGEKVWIKAEYLKNIDPIKSPCAAERRKFIKAYIRRNIRDYKMNMDDIQKAFERRYANELA